MESVKDYVEANLSLASAEKQLKEELAQLLDISVDNIKSISLENFANDTKIVQKVIIELRGSNRIKCCKSSGIDGITIVTPNTIEIEVGEFDL